MKITIKHVQTCPVCSGKKCIWCEYTGELEAY